MLYNYPPDATKGNWLHCCLVQVLMRVHRDLDLKKTPPSWPQIIPVEYRENLKLKRGLRDRLKTYTDTLKSLSDAERQSVHETLVRQNQLRRLLSGQRICQRIDALPEKIRDPAKNLFEFAFGLLTDLEIRDTHYQTIYDSSIEKLCPFCGLEYFDAPGAPREDDDHYLPKTHYPFAAANLWNLVPMGHKCNSRYKKTIDPIMEGGGVSRRALDPYGKQCFAVSLAGTVMTEVPDKLEFKWNIVFEPNVEEAETWNAMFDLRTRYGRDILRCHWMAWLTLFRDYADAKGVNDDRTLREALHLYCLNQRRRGLRDQAFLKAAFYEMVLNEWDNGNQAIKRILRTITYGR